MRKLRAIGSRFLARSDWLGRAVTTGLNWYEGRKGPVYAQRHYRQSLDAGRSVRRGLTELAVRWPDVHSPAQDRPVFILSAGWRSGSTMLQRLIMSCDSILIWGEPYSHAHILQHLASGVSAITTDWPRDDWFVDQYKLDELSTCFVANMYPKVNDLLEASLAYMRTLFEMPALERGFKRWGLKEVRLTIEDAAFLHWLYPQAKFVFLCRNPYDAYRSYRLDRSWYNEWPNDPVFTAGRFGRHWRELASGFVDGRGETGGMLMRYEDISAGTFDVSALEAYLELKVDASLLNKKVGTHRRTNDAVPRAELGSLRREVGELASTLGYE